jgi:hypothetical protein
MMAAAAASHAVSATVAMSAANLDGRAVGLRCGRQVADRHGNSRKNET